jgi:hypothetical protein
VSKTKTITIIGNAAVCVSKYCSFDPAKPTATRVDEFTFLNPAYVVDGKLDGWNDFRLVGSTTITIELMPVKDMTQAAVEQLKAEKQKVLADAYAAATRIEGEIQKLLAIAFDGAEVEA